MMLDAVSPLPPPLTMARSRFREAQVMMKKAAATRARP